MTEKVWTAATFAVWFFVVILWILFAPLWRLMFFCGYHVKPENVMLRWDWSGVVVIPTERWKKMKYLESLYDSFDPKELREMDEVDKE